MTSAARMLTLIAILAGLMRPISIFADEASQHGPNQDGTFFWKWITSAGLRWCSRSTVGRQANAQIELLGVEVLPKPNAYIMHCVDKRTGAKLDLPLNIGSEIYPQVTVHPEVAHTRADPSDSAVADRLCRGIDVNFHSFQVEKDEGNRYLVHCIREIPTVRNYNDPTNYDESLAKFSLPVEMRLTGSAK